MATKALNKWLKAWKGRNYKEMLKHSQISWVNQNYYERGRKIDVRLYLKNLYKNTELLEYEILEAVPAKYKGGELDSNIMTDVRVKCKVYYKNVPICRDEIRLIRLINENKEGKPTANGEWGVNPMSALRKESPDVKQAV
jgi:hypothetical protein